MKLSNEINIPIILIPIFPFSLDLQLLKQSKIEGKPLAILQLERAQKMKGEGIKAEREALRTAVLTVTKECEYVTLGIMAETGDEL